MLLRIKAYSLEFNLVHFTLDDTGSEISAYSHKDPWTGNCPTENSSETAKDSPASEAEDVGWEPTRCCGSQETSVEEVVPGDKERVPWAALSPGK